MLFGNPPPQMFQQTHRPTIERRNELVRQWREWKGGDRPSNQSTNHNQPTIINQPVTNGKQLSVNKVEKKETKLT